MIDRTDPPRYTTQPLPPYSYVPGRFPHPISDPAGHRYGQHEPAAAPIDETNWRTHATWLFAVDLFNRGYYWEAHEAWEALWHAADRSGPIADFLKGLIKLAAAGVKAREGRSAGVRLHAARAYELLAPHAGETKFGIAVNPLLAAASQMEQEAEALVDTSVAAVVRALPIVIRLAAN